MFGPDPFSQGLIARRNGDYARAVAAFQTALNSNPASDLAQAAQFRLGEAYWLDQDHPRAITALNVYLQVNPQGPNAPESRYFLADAYRKVKDYASALAQYRLYRDSPRRFKRTLTEPLGTCSSWQGIRRALSSSTTDRSRTRRRPRRPRSASCSAPPTSHRNGEPALAAARLDAALALTTDARLRADLDNRAGEAYAAAGKTDLAVARWTRRSSNIPSTPELSRHWSTWWIGNWRVDDFNGGLSITMHGLLTLESKPFRPSQIQRPRAGDAHYYLASSYVKKSAYAQAIAEFDIVISHCPKTSAY